MRLSAPSLAFRLNPGTAVEAMLGSIEAPAGSLASVLASASTPEKFRRFGAMEDSCSASRARGCELEPVLPGVECGPPGRDLPDVACARAMRESQTD